MLPFSEKQGMRRDIGCVVRDIGGERSVFEETDPIFGRLETAPVGTVQVIGRKGKKEGIGILYHVPDRG